MATNEVARRCGTTDDSVRAWRRRRLQERDLLGVVMPDRSSAITTSFADGGVSRYAIGPDGTLTLADATAGLSVDGRPGLRHEALTPTPAICTRSMPMPARSSAGRVGPDGSLDAIGSWGALPATAAGLAAA